MSSNISDWICITCNYKIFGRKDKCSKCNYTREENNVFSNNLPPMEKSSINLLDISSNSNKFYDWTCMNCNTLVFGRKRYCHICYKRNPFLPHDL